MDQFKIVGGNRLLGEVDVYGVKNGILPIMAASILGRKGETILRNVPNLRDVRTMSKVLECLGAKINYDPATRVWTANCENINKYLAPYEFVKQMRASFLVLGPMLSRFGKVEISLPGGCAIGARSVNMHIEGLKKMGARVSEREGLLVIEAKKLKGVDFYFDFPTHTGTENLIMAACMAKGITNLYNASCEPEVVDLVVLLNKMGAKISGAGTPVISVEGVSGLNGIEYDALPSRIECSFFMVAAAITKGDLKINNVNLQHIGIVADKLRRIGVDINQDGKNSIRVKSTNRLKAINLTTWPFPGFPTDFQAQMMALLALSNGTSIVKETIFENRFMHVNELNRLGAEISVHLDEAVVKGVKNLKGAPVMASDLQAGAGLVLAALAANGDSTVDRVYHIDRGYETIEKRLLLLGASIERFNPVKNGG